MNITTTIPQDPPVEIKPLEPKIFCETCRYFVPGDKGYGSCHRYPPSTADDEYFPEVAMGAWCGEWRSKSAPLADQITHA